MKVMNVLHIRRQLILDRHLHDVDYTNGHELNSAIIAAMEQYAQEVINKVILRKKQTIGIKAIRQQLKDVGIKGSVKYLKENEKGKHDCTCMYEIKFPPISGVGYWDDAKEVIDEFDASCLIEDYLEDTKRAERP
jgi:hypothetical protein